jgi:hypothetical protein
MTFFNFLLKMNLLDDLKKIMSEYLLNSHATEAFKNGKSVVIERLLDNLDQFSMITHQIKNFIKSYEKIVLKKLDRIKCKSLRDVFLRLQTNLDTLVSYIRTREDNFTEDISKSIKVVLPRLEFEANILDQFADESFGTFPNVELWFLSDGVPVGACTFTANDLIWSDDRYKRGNLCATMMYADVKSLNKADGKDFIRQNIARVKLYIWLGYEKDKSNIFENADSMLFKNSDKSDFDVIEFHENCGLPREIVYKGESKVKLESKRLWPRGNRYKFIDQT